MNMTGGRDVAEHPWRAEGNIRPIGPRDVHVWSVSVRAWARQENVLRGLLVSDELARAERFHFAMDRLQFIVAHGLLRGLLAHYTGAAPSKLRFAVGSAGKPNLEFPVESSPLRFNLSHSADRIMIALTRLGAVGIDIERWQPDVDCGELIRRFFSPVERAEFLALDADQRYASFFACWTRKEAYIKATGLGVSLGLDYFDVVVAAGRPGRLLADRFAPDHPALWRMYDLDVAAGYSSALVVAGSDARPRFFDLEPGTFSPLLSTDGTGPRHGAFSCG